MIEVCSLPRRLGRLGLDTPKMVISPNVFVEVTMSGIQSCDCANELNVGLRRTERIQYAMSVFSDSRFRSGDVRAIIRPDPSYWHRFVVVARSAMLR